MSKKSFKESAIIEAIKHGDKKVLFVIYDELRNEFISWTVANHQVDKEDAKDLFQDAIIDLHNNVRDGKFFASSTSIKTYLFSIGKNKILNFINRGVNNYDFSEVNEGTLISQESVDDLKINIIKTAILEMGEKCRNVLLMFYERGFDMESIASNMGYASANVAKKKKHECLKKLELRSKELLKQHHG